MQVAEMLEHTHHDAVTVRPTDTIATFAHRLQGAGVGAMAVQGQDSKLVGMISECDVVRGIAEHGAGALQMTVADLMTSRVVACSPKDDLDWIGQVMTDNRIRHLPVVNGDELTGLISVGDVVKIRLDEMSLEVRLLRDTAGQGARD
jgi:CBS domain-containing protein